MPMPQLKVRAISSGSIFPCAWRNAISRGCSHASASICACSVLGRMRGIFSSSPPPVIRSEEHTSELQSLMRISYAVFCLKKNKKHKQNTQSKSYTLIQHIHKHQ